MTTNAHKTLDAAAYLYLAQVAADLRLRGARYVVQELVPNVGFSDLVVKAVVPGTHAAVERIVQHIIHEADKRGFRLNRVPEDRRGLDDHEHDVRFYHAVDPAV